MALISKRNKLLKMILTISFNFKNPHPLLLYLFPLFSVNDTFYFQMCEKLIL